MTDAAPTDPKPRRWPIYALIASLAVNLAVIGLVAGLALKGPPERPGPEMGLWRYAGALPEPYRGDMMRQLRDSRDAWRMERDRLAGQRQILARALTAEPYDRATVESALALERSLLDGLAMQGTQALLGQIDRMNAQDRADYAERLLAGPKGPRKGPPHERHEPGRGPEPDREPG
jgi:uncharacterized membrane protein